MSINDNLFLIVAMAALLVVWILNMTKGKGKGSGKLNKLKCASPKRVHGIPFGKFGNKVVYSPTYEEGHIGVFAGTGMG